MIAAQGFAAVIEATNQVPTLVEASVNWIGNSQGIGCISDAVDWFVNHLGDWFVFLNHSYSSDYLCSAVYPVWF